MMQKSRSQPSMKAMLLRLRTLGPRLTWVSLAIVPVAAAAFFVVSGAGKSVLLRHMRAQLTDLEARQACVHQIGQCTHPQGTRRHALLACVDHRDHEALTLGYRVRFGSVGPSGGAGLR